MTLEPLLRLGPHTRGGACSYSREPPGRTRGRRHHTPVDLTSRGGPVLDSVSAVAPVVVGEVIPSGQPEALSSHSAAGLIR